jgi:NAD+ diphosphatase
MDPRQGPAPNLFVTFELDRVTHKRRDSAWVERQLQDPGTHFVPVWQSENLFTEEPVPRARFLTYGEIEGLMQQAESVVLLGQAPGQIHEREASPQHQERHGPPGLCATRVARNPLPGSYFAVGFPLGDGSPPEALTKLGWFRNLRHVGALLDPWEGALLAYARAMAYWHRRQQFCGKCGSPTASAEGGHVQVCTNPRCGQEHFPRTDPAIIVLVTSGERCLLGRKAFWAPGLHSIIAGFVEPGESLEAAVAREVAEETGVSLQAVHYHSSQPWPFPKSLMLGFTAQAASEGIQLNDGELETARWFSRQEIQDALQDGSLQLPTAISISHRLIEEWFDARAPSRPLHEIVSLDARQRG